MAINSTSIFWPYDFQPTLRFRMGLPRFQDFRLEDLELEVVQVIDESGVKVIRWVFYLQSDHTFFYHEIKSVN
jgi:hypothetical protein